MNKVSPREISKGHLAATPYRCPDCGDTPLRHLGTTISFGQWAGGNLIYQRDRSMYECRACHLVSKYPRISDDAARALYNESDGTVWTASIPRPEFVRALQIVDSYSGRSAHVLDVGCNRGEFLERLPASVKRYGVEVNKAAAEVARRGGATIWQGVDAIPAEIRFDIVTCFDVIEHVEVPSRFVGSLLARLKPGGRLVLSSGNATTFIAQFRPALNWYFANPEHISFVSERWLRAVVRNMNSYTVESVMPFLHGREVPGWIPWIKILAFKVWPSGYLAIYAWAKSIFSSGQGLFVPGNGHDIDHLCVVIRRTASA